ncbi:hypothetical protein CLV77_1201 [Brevirhabdus pacifica]|nr:hypothetical protein [Brevirhabdus pacifica]PJJ86648.1 hypothetical protein CLV77_1201 [Brevirhabdus pacifica]
MSQVASRPARLRHPPDRRFFRKPGRGPLDVHPETLRAAAQGMGPTLPRGRGLHRDRLSATPPIPADLRLLSAVPALLALLALLLGGDAPLLVLGGIAIPLLSVLTMARGLRPGPDRDGDRLADLCW